MSEPRIEIGKIVTFEPSDSLEWGVVYSVSEDGRQGMGAFVNQCSWLGAVRFRTVSVEDGLVKVRHHYEAKVRDGHAAEGVAFDWEANTDENDLAALMKIAARNPKELEPSYDADKTYTEREWPCKMELARFRKGIYDILVRCEWVRRLWPSCPDKFLNSD